MGIFTDAPHSVASEKPAPHATWTALCRPGGEVCAGGEGGGRAGSGWAARAAAPGPDEVRVQEHPPETERILGEGSDPAGAAAGAPAAVSSQVHRLFSGPPMTTSLGTR